MSIGTYNLLLLVHVLAFVYWLGADLGVLYAAKFGADYRLSSETRQKIGDVMAFVDMFPRLSVPLVGASGISIAYLSGAIEFSQTWIWVTWVAAFVWIASNLFIYLNRSNPESVSSAKSFDVLWRVGLLILVGGAAASSFLGVGITRSHSLAAKLLIFSLTIALSLILRLLFRRYRPALNRIASGGDNATESAIMNRALTLARPVVFAIWSLAIVAAAIGLWKPY